MPKYEVIGVVHVRFYVVADSESQAEDKAGDADWADHARDMEIESLRRVSD